jgi:hypothetical protein
MDNFKVSELLGAFTRKQRGAQDDLRPFCTTKSVEVIVADKFGRVKSRSITDFSTKKGPPNLRVNGGADFWNTQLFATTPAAGAQANYIALTTDSTAPAATDTVLTAEETTNGLARAQATVTHSAGAGSALISHTFTYSGAVSKTIAKVGLFNQLALGGTLVLETLLASTATVNTNGDQVTINWTVNF